MTRVKYQITTSEGTIFDVTFSREQAQDHISMSIRYGAVGYYNLGDQVLTILGFWKQLERNNPGMRNQLELALEDYLSTGSHLTIMLPPW